MLNRYDERRIDHYHVNMTLMLPTMLLEILDSPLSETTDLSSLKACFVAGDECSHDLYQRFKKRMGHDLLQAFGMTECEGWLYGGDIASRDEDGFYIFLERKREIIIHGGSNVGPHEVEDIIDSHPDVKESCVVGISNAHYGAILEDYIEWEPDARHPDIAGLTTWVASRIAAYKVPDRWRVMERLPRTATGKLDRKSLHLKADSEAENG